ncbi:hypothetical protein MHU86_5913 [Fragilaria crotonensis]|nr:hypothetical protein MHU86_5913 [Fragilaria crotonensis]
MCFEDYLLLFVRQKMFIELMMPQRSSELVEVEQTADQVTTTTADRSDAVFATIMPENWMFPGFIVFSLFGPIVEPEMRYYQSHLLMTMPKDGTSCGDENRTGGGNRLLASDKKNKRHEARVKVEPGGPLSNRSYLPGNQKFTVSQEFQKVAMEQSKLLLESHEENMYNDCLVSMHTTKVAGVKARIEDVKFLFLHSATDDPARAEYMQKLKALNDELETALRELTECEISIVESLKKSAIAKVTTKRTCAATTRVMRGRATMISSYST